MIILACDPGTIKSAFCLYDSEEEKPIGFKIVENEYVRMQHLFSEPEYIFVVEMIACYGMPVGKEVFETCLWMGHFMQQAKDLKKDVKRLYRSEVKLHLCKSSRANDASVRQALIDRFGPCGTKKKPGVLYGCKKDLWSALSIAVTYSDLNTARK